MVMGRGKSKPVWMICSLILLRAVNGNGQQIDRKCFGDSCLRLVITNGKVVAERSGEVPGQLELGKYDPRGKSLVRSSDAPIGYSRTPRGWTAVVTAYIPEKYLLWTELRIYIF